MSAQNVIDMLIKHISGLWT